MEEQTLRYTAKQMSEFSEKYQKAEDQLTLNRTIETLNTKFQEFLDNPSTKRSLSFIVDAKIHGYLMHSLTTLGYKISVNGVNDLDGDIDYSKKELIIVW